MSFSLKYLLEQANIGQSRSSVLNPLQWMLVILIAGIAVCLLLHAPGWLVILFALLLVVVLLLFLISYVYFMRKNPDALRSEQFSLSKLALEKGMIGDSLLGLQPANDVVLSGGAVVPVNPSTKSQN